MSKPDGAVAARAGERLFRKALEVAVRTLTVIW